MTDEQPTPLPQPGWYADYAGGPGLRYWDGAAWTDHVSTPVAPQPYSTAAAPAATPESAKAAAHNPFIWLYAVVPLVTLAAYLLLPWQQIESAVVASGGTAQINTGAYGMASPLTTLLSWVAIGLSILFAVLDWNRLRKSGVERPFHWAFVFFALIGQPIVYMIGRSVVVKRRTGTGLAPLWLFIVIQLAAWITVIVLVVNLISAVIAQAGLGSTGSFS